MAKKYFPVLMDIEDRPILIVGGGPIAARKATTFAPYGPRIRMVARAASELAKRMAAEGAFVLEERPFELRDLDEPVLVIAATNDRALHEEIKAACDARRIPCNVVDVTDLCSFTLPSIIRRGELMVTISTDGTCPAYSKYQRKRMEACCFHEGCEDMLHAVAAARNELKGPLGEGLDDEEKFACLRGLAEAELPPIVAERGEAAGIEHARRRIHEIVAEFRAARPAG